MADPISEDSIRELIESLNRLTRSMENKGTSDTGTDNTAFKKSGEIFSKGIKDMLDKAGKMTKNAAANMTMATEQSSDRTKKAADAMSSAMSKTGDGFLKLSKNADHLTTALAGVGSAAKALTKELYKGTKGAGIYAEATETAVDSIASFAQIVGGPVGIALGGLTKALTGAMVIATKQADAQFSSYKELQRFGGATAGGVDDIFKFSQSLNIGQGELEKLNQLVSKASSELAMMSGSVGAGIKTMAGISKTLDIRGVRDDFLSMGISIEEQNESIASYIRFQSRLGLTQRKSVDQLASSVQEYVEEQNKLTKLTGASRERQEAALERAMAVEQFRAKLVEMQASGQDEEAKALQARFKALGSLPGGEQLQTAMASAVTGFITKAGQGAFIATGGEMLNLATNMSLSTEQFIENLGRAVETSSGAGSALHTLAATAGEFQNVTGMSYGALMDFTNATKDATVRMKAVGEEVAEQKIGDISPTTKALADIEALTIDTRKQIEQLVQIAVPASIGAMNALATGANRAAEAINSLAGGMEGIEQNLSQTSSIRRNEGLVDKSQGTYVDIYGGANRDLATGEVIERALGGISSGPRSGYPAILHGTEAVVPLPDGKTIPVSIKSDIGQQGNDMSSFTDSLTKFSDVVKKSSASALTAHSFEFEKVLSKFDDSVEKLTDIEKEKSGFDKIIDMFRSSVKSFGKSSMMLPDYLESGPVFGREDTEYEDKSLELLTQIKDYLAESLGIEIPSLDLGGGGGGGAVTPGGVAAGGGMQPGQSLPMGEMQQKTMEELKKQGISDPKAIANIMSQIQHESGFRPRSEEVGQYSPETLFRMYGKGNKGGNKVRFQSIEEARQLVAQGPEAVGNVIYGGRMGNAPTEGFAYRGRGLIQLTGKANYEKFGKKLGIDLVSNPDLANDPEIAAKIAALYYAEKQKAGTNLADIRSIGKATGYAGGPAETQRRAQTAQQFMASKPPGIPGAADGGILSGPTSGFMAELHGTEAVVPLPDGKSIPVDFGGFGDTLSNIGSSIGGMFGGDIGKSIGGILGGAGEGLGGMFKSFQNVIAPSMDNYSKGIASPFDRAISSEFNISNLLSTLQNNNYQVDQALMSSIDSLGARLTNAFAQSTTAGQSQDPISRDLMQQLVNLAREQNMNIVKLIQANLS